MQCGEIYTQEHPICVPSFGNEFADFIFSFPTSGPYKSYLILGFFKNLEYGFCRQLYMVGVVMLCS